jgi:hypothetical protein
MRNIFHSAFLAIVGLSLCSCGFYGHKKINQLSVFTLPPEMIGFYKKNLSYIVETSVNPDRRRFSLVDEAPRHYIDLDHYGDSVFVKMPKYWNHAVEKYSEDTLKAYGIVPWHVYRVYHQLRDAFFVQDPQRILKLSAELGHYIGDAHVPLHTTENYNGQLTGQDGIHGFWESRLVELFSEDYDFLVGRAQYLRDPQGAIWQAVEVSHHLKDSVLDHERQLARRFGERKFSFETKGKQTVKVYSLAYSKAYHKVLRGMVERRMQAAVRMVGSFWYTAWVDAGKPDLNELINRQPTDEELLARRKELEELKQKKINSRSHEGNEE